MSHPLNGTSFLFRNFKGFSDQPGKPIVFAPISLLVGRNNSGKSAVIDALDIVLSNGKNARSAHSRSGTQYSIEIGSVLTEQSLRPVFHENTSSAEVPAQNHWEFGSRFIGAKLVRSYGPSWHPNWVSGPNLASISEGRKEFFAQEIMKAAPTPAGLLFRIAAERNVVPEKEATPEPVKPDGTGLTNLIRAFLYNSDLPMLEVEKSLLDDLNTIYLGDAKFTRILARRHGTGHWELYLQEENGQPIQLSESGSSLKTIFIILATLRLNPIVAPESKLDNNLFCVEEPENNLHPSLLRRLLEFLAHRSVETNSSLVITTHSSAAIDWATRRDDANTYHIRRNVNGGSISEASEYLALRDLLQDLDIRASEILQANGVIWVEGPSDRLYVRRWLEIASQHSLQEGVHYSIMFYGGKLLSHLSALPPDEADQAISLLRLNRNLVVLIDSDRRRLKSGKFRADLNVTKRRIIREAKTVNGYVWITEGKEIENYLSRRIISELSDGTVNGIGKFESVPDKLNKYSGDKVSLAHLTAEMTDETDLDVLDLRSRVAELVNCVKSWNS